MRRTRAGLKTAALGLVLAAAGAAPAAADYTARGQINCANQNRVHPLAGARVALYEDDSTNRFIKATHTDVGGNFEMRIDTDVLDAEDDDDVFISIELVTSGGRVEVFDQGDYWAGADNVDTDSIPNGSGTANFGRRVWFHSATPDSGEPFGLRFSGTPSCALFIGARRAATDFKTATGTTMPLAYDLVYGAPTAGVPYTNNSQTAWPENKATGFFSTKSDAVGKLRNGFKLSFHEFGHVFRHHFDGSYKHFLGDVGDFDYLQHHSGCKHTNKGFAFNEGWAMYWESFRDLGVCAENGTSMEFEKNVANRLQFAESCSSRATLVRVLRENPGTIHSFGEFASRLSKFNAKCAADANSVPFKPKPAGSAAQAQDPEDEDADYAPLPPEQIESAVAARLVALDEEVERLEGELASARGSEVRTRRCRALIACVRRSEAIAAPFVLETQVALAKAQAAYLRERLDTARAAGFQVTPAVLDVLAKQDAAYATTGRRVARRGLLRATRGLRKAPGGAPMAAAVRRVSSRLRTVRGGRRGVPDAFVLRTSPTAQLR